MATSVGDPFLLSNYSIPRNSPATGTSSPKLSNLYASHQNGLSPEGHVVATVQGDGLHILDPSTLHPVVSHTLGPTSVFTCPAVSRLTQNEEGSTCSTYAALESIQGIDSEERGRHVRVWQDRISSEGPTSAVHQRTRSGIVPYRVSRIAICEELPENVLYIGQHGELTVTDSDLTVQHTHDSYHDEARLIRPFVFSRRSCTFIPSRSAVKQGAIVVMLVRVGVTVDLVVAGVNGSGITVLGQCSLSDNDAEIVDASCSESGFVSVLFQSGEWRPLQIDSPDHTNINLTIPSSPLSLTGLACVGRENVTSLEEASLLSLGSSHVLLAGVTTGNNPELALLLWDLQYGVLLSSRLIAVPASAQRHPKYGVDLHLTRASAGTQQALLVISPRSSTGRLSGISGQADRQSNDTAQRSSVLVVPYIVPSTSTVANALGRANTGEKWLSSAKTLTKGNTSTSNLDVDQLKCLSAMREAMGQKRLEVIDEAFFEWSARTEAKNATAPAKNTATKLSYGYEFVKQVLGIALQAQEGRGQIPPYSAKIVRHLLDKRCVSSNMVSGGLLPALTARKDWSSILVALRCVIDVPEDDLVSLLSLAVRSSTKKGKQSAVNESAMDVDARSDSSTPGLSTVLPLCVTYSTSAAALRLAFRRRLNDVRAMTTILGLLLEWLRAYAEEEPQLLPERTKKDLHGALIPAFKEEKNRKTMLPPVEKTLLFIQTLLDSSFLLLLSYPASCRVLQEIMSFVDPELAFAHEVGQLRGPLEPFVKAHRKMVYEAAHGPNKPDSSSDWRKKRKAVHEQAAIAIGVYQVEELVL